MINVFFENEHVKKNVLWKWKAGNLGGEMPPHHVYHIVDINQSIYPVVVAAHVIR